MNSLPNDKNWTKVNESICRHQIKCCKMTTSLLDRTENIVENIFFGENVGHFLPFSTAFPKCILLCLWVIKSQGCVVKS